MILLNPALDCNKFYLSLLKLNKNKEQMSELIAIDKVYGIEEKDSSGNKITIPGTGRPLISKWSSHEETVRLDEIKSARVWKKSRTQETSFDGGLTILYMMGADQKDQDPDSRKSRVPSIIINETLESFNARAGVIKLSKDA